MPLRSHLAFSLFLLLGVCSPLCAQQERHGRGYKPPASTAPVVVTVEKEFNGKPLPNASVVFRSPRDEAMNGNLEMKTDPQGRASMDLLEVGSHVTVQVIANGFATYATTFDLTADGKEVLIKLQRPRAQVSTYDDGQDRAAEVRPGVQERVKQGAPTPIAPTSVAPAGASPTTPLQTTPPANTPATVPGGSPASSAPGKPQ